MEPVYPKRKTPSKIDDYAEVLSSWLTRESGRSRKQRRNLRKLYGDLVHLGYRGSYDRVAAFARAWRVQQQEAVKASRGTFIPLVFAPGEAFQFDWSEDWAVIGGERRKLMVAHFKLSYSRAFIVRAYPMPRHEMLFDAHNPAFLVLGGVPQRGIVDNMKTAVNRVGRGKLREVNARFQVMASHFLIETTFCSPAAGWEKGQIEKNVRDPRSRLWHDAPAFANQAVSLRVYAERLVVVAEGCVVVEHRRLFAQGHDRAPQVLYDWRHYLAVVQRKPGALRNGAPFDELPNGFKRLQSVLLKRPGGDREIVDVLALVLHHDEQTVLCAVELSLETGAPSKQHVINILNRLLEADAPVPIDTPAGFSLSEEPKANVDRYDYLRGQPHAG